MNIMPSVKDSVIDFIKDLPDDLTVEEIAYKFKYLKIIRR